jgi:hypothetical protein
MLPAVENDDILRAKLDSNKREWRDSPPLCAVCKDAYSAWSNACPARRKEM